MPGTLPNPDWHHVFLDGEVWYYCNEEVVYDSHEGAPIILPPRFLHNGGSIPWIFTAGLKPNGLMLNYYALHDYTYRKDFPLSEEELPREQADKLLYFYGREAGYPWLKCQAVYAGVAAGGWRSWKKRESTFYPIKQ